MKNSFREGIELDGAWNPDSKFSVSGNVTFSRNKINEFREYTDDYDNGGQVLTIYTDTDIAFSPSFTAFLLAGWRPLKGFEAQLAGKYTGKQYLDNTSNNNSVLDPWLVTDLRLNYTIQPKFMKAITFTFMINNLLDEMYESNGYAFSYIYGGTKTTENYYYPQAGRNFMGMVTLNF
jgi:iron complex outermembrane receptor protein